MGFRIPRTGDKCPDSFNRIPPTDPYCIESVNDINLHTREACFNEMCAIVQTASQECADKATQEACGLPVFKDEKEEADSKGEEEADSKGEKEADSKGEEEADSKKEEEADSKGEEEADSKGEEEADSKGEEEGGSEEEKTAAFVQLKKFGVAATIIVDDLKWSFLEPEDFCGHAPKYNFCMGHKPS